MYLNCHSWYSYRYGTLSLEELLQTASEAGAESVALTDINSTAAIPDFVRMAPAYGIRPVAGIDFRNAAEPCFTALARNNEGFYEINSYLSSLLHRKMEIPPEAPPFSQAYVIYPFSKAPQRSLYENERIGLRPADLPAYRFSKWRQEEDKMIIMQPMTFRNKRDFNAHRLLRAIDLNTLLSKLPRSEEAPADDVYRSPAELVPAFREFPRIIAATRQLLGECHIHFDFGHAPAMHNKSTYTGNKEEDRALIRALCHEGLEYRYGENPSPEVKARVEHELEVLEKMDFYAYFLINWDIVNYARRKNYFYVGRGSGANSMVAYLLRITDVDPLELDLYFERFINPSRKSPPDFDIDFSWRDRQDMTRYIFSRFPTAVLLGSHSTFQYRSVLRELGKVMGLPPREIDALIKKRKSSEVPGETGRLVMHYAGYIRGFPNFPGIHASGILIPRKSIHHYGATFLPPKGFPTTFFDMYAAEDIGLHKFDILGQRGLAKIKEALEIIRENRPEAGSVDIHNMERLKKDSGIRALLREGKTMACFYVESPAMRSLLKKLQVEDYLGLVAASSIIRPGVSQSGMMAEFIKRYREPSARKYLHPKIEELLSETFGVMVYQEDVLKVAHYFAGLTLEEADILRRGMSWKFRERNEFHRVKQQFFDNCKARGYAGEIAVELWRQIESFANYAFAKGHSASYAVESYQSLYLKAHFPLEYMVAVINNGGGFYRTETYIHEARMHGARIEAPCVNHSHEATSIRGKVIWLGFHLLKSLEQKLAESIVKERLQRGPFAGLPDFIGRVSVSLEQLILLIRAGAFRNTGKSKKELLWEAHFLLGHSRHSKPGAELFRTEIREPVLPPLESHSFEDAFDEIELLGFSLASPFALLASAPRDVLPAAEMAAYVGKKVRMLGYLVHVKNVATRQDTPRHMQFGCFLDEAGHFIDTVHFPPVAAHCPFRGKGIYLLEGRVVSDYDALSLEVQRMQKMEIVNPAEV